MGLDARVYCNCYETGKLREPPPYPDLIRIAEYGGLYFANPDWEQVKHLGWASSEWQAAINKDIEFDQWLALNACEHPDGVLVHHRIGNMWRVSDLRQELGREPQKFPAILGKVLYSGIHAGDYVKDFEQLKIELGPLSAFRCSTSELDQYMQYFHQQMSELVAAALSVNKAICF